MREEQAGDLPGRGRPWRPEPGRAASGRPAGQIAEAVVAKAGREHPADTVLRELLRDERGLPREVSRDISRTVFNFYRWRGWLDADEPLARQLARADELAQRLLMSPEKFAADDFTRAVPAWIDGAMTVTPEWRRTLQSEPRRWLRAKRGEGRALAERLGECWIPPQPAFADAVEYQGGEDLFRAAEFHAGSFELQDLNSQAVSLLCRPQPGETWWDACAGEGGKTLHLSDLMQNKGLIWASDRAEWRLKKLRLRAGRAQCFNYRPALWDGGAKPPTKKKFDGVLVDAPCSGVGTWQRNPHARWTTTPEDVRELADLQADILAHVAPSVKPGGRLIYSVCTLTRAETGGVVRAFSEAFPDFEPLPLPDLFAPRETPGPPSPVITLWPQATGGNGMFVAAWQKRPSPFRPVA